jgi:hypothetical protein
MKIRNENSLIEMLVACAATCNNCLHECLNEKDIRHLTTCIDLDIDCAAICNLTASFISRDSGFAKTILPLCAEICTACAEECEKHDMEHCRRCAAICRQCAEQCHMTEVVLPNG